MALSKEFRAQYALESAENTDPRNFKLQDPMERAASRTPAAALYCPAPRSS